MSRGAVRGAFVATILELARERATTTLDYLLAESDAILANAENLPNPLPCVEYADDEHACLLLDADGRIIYANPVICAMFEMPPSKLEGRCLWALTCRERAEPRKQIMESVIATGNTYEYIDTDGHDWFESKFIPLKTNGRVAQVVLVAMRLSHAPEPFKVRVIQ